MAFPVAPGAAQYSGNFIPEIWSSKLIENFYDASVLPAISNTDYEGEIKSQGDTVNIRTTPTINTRPYQKGMTLTVDRPDKPKIQLLIDQGEYFAVIEDDVDKVQADINLMDTWSKDASENMKLSIDREVLTGMLTDISSLNQGATAGRISQNINLGVAGTPLQLTKTSARLHRRHGHGPGRSQRTRVGPLHGDPCLDGRHDQKVGPEGRLPVGRRHLHPAQRPPGHDRHVHPVRVTQPEPRDRHRQHLLQHRRRPQDGPDLRFADDRDGKHPC